MKIIHNDLFNQDLNDNDIVVAADGVRGQLKICKVVYSTKKMVRIEPLDNNSRGRIRSFLRYPKFLIKIDRDLAVEYILALDTTE